MSVVFCESNKKKHKSMCAWTILDWKTIRTRSIDTKLTSEIFSSPTNDGTKWCLDIHLMGKTGRRSSFTGNNGDYASVYLRLVSVKNGSVARAKFDLSAVDGKNTMADFFTMGPATIDINTNPRIGKNNAFMTRDLNNFVQYDELKLVCYVVEYTDIADDLWTRMIIVPECQIIENYRVLFETKAFSDVKIIAKGNIEHEAHIAILTAQSSVFAAMFKHEMREQSNNFIEMMDTDPKVLEEMLRFIYTGKVSDIDEMAIDVLAVADKYDLQRLKIMCEEKLRTTFSIENAAHIFMITDRYSCKQLKTLIGSFISQHVKDVMLTEGYSLMIESYPHFAEKLLQEMFL